MPIQYYYMVTNRGVVNKCGSIASRSESSLCCHCHPVDGALDPRDPLICTISPNIFAEMNVTCALEQLSLDITPINMYVNSYGSFCCQLIVCVSC